MIRTRQGLLIAGLLASAIACFGLALALGSVTLSLGEIASILGGTKSGVEYTVLMELRLPRALKAFATGGLLALAGALMQALLRNPLADPYILGTSGGAAVAALGALWLGLGSLWVNASAFAGALLSMGLVFTLSRGRGSWTPTRLLLTGVVIAAGWGALISFILSISPLVRLHGMLFWLMGDLRPGPQPWPGLVVLAAGLGMSLTIARNLNLLARGELQASALGVPVARTRIFVYLLASLLTATAVTLAGTVGFLGLVTPHLLRLIGGSDHRFLLPAAALLGGCLLLTADTLARTLLAPQQLPVGIVTALIGVPVFLFLLRREGTSGANPR